MKNKKKLIIGGAIIVTLIAVACIIFMNHLGKAKWDLEANVSEELRQYQNYWVSSGKLMKSDNGYYCIARGNNSDNICYWDGQSDKYYSICDKANCKHDNESCAASFESPAVSNMQYMIVTELLRFAFYIVIVLLIGHISRYILQNGNKYVKRR